MRNQNINISRGEPTRRNLEALIFSSQIRSKNEHKLQKMKSIPKRNIWVAASNVLSFSLDLLCHFFIQPRSKIFPPKGIRLVRVTERLHIRRNRAFFPNTE